MGKSWKRSCVGRKRTTPSIQSYLPDFDAVHAWTSRDRVIMNGMTAFLARQRQNVFVEMKEMEKHMLSPIDTEGIIGVLA